MSGEGGLGGDADRHHHHHHLHQHLHGGLEAQAPPGGLSGGMSGGDSISSPSAGGEASPSASSTSRPIPIMRSQARAGGLMNPNSNSLATGAGKNFAQSAPAPRAPIIGSMPAPSYLSRRMPDLELPPPSPGASAFGSRNLAQSAPTYAGNAGTNILHALRIRPRSGSNDGLDLAKSGQASGSNSQYNLGQQRRQRESRARSRQRVSFDGDLGRSPILLEGDEEEEEEEEEEQLGTGLVDAWEGSNRSLQMEPSSMEVFSAIRSLTEDRSGFARRTDMQLHDQFSHKQSESGGMDVGLTQDGRVKMSPNSRKNSPQTGAVQAAETAAMVGDLESLRLDADADTYLQHNVPSIDMDDMEMEMGLDLDTSAHAGLDMDDGPFEQFEMEGLSGDKQLLAGVDDDDDRLDGSLSSSPSSR